MGVSIGASNITQSSAYLGASWSGLSNPSGAVIECNGEQVAGWEYTGTTRYSISGGISGLSPNTTYTANVSVWDDGVYADSASVTFTTLPIPEPEPDPDPIVGMPTINSIDVTDNMATIGYSKGAYNTEVYFEFSWDGGSIVVIANDYPYFHFMLQAYNLEHMVRAKGVYNYGVESAWTGYSYFNTQPKPPDASIRPPNWSWSYNIASGEPVLQTTMSADKGSICAYILSNDDWNNFTMRINHFRRYYDYHHVAYLANAMFTTVSPDMLCTPSIINEAIEAINEIGFNIPTIGTMVGIASVLNNMKNCLNSIV